MEFIKEKDFLKNRLKEVPRYKTLQEKEALLIDDEIEDAFLYYDTLCPNSKIKPLNEMEALAFILKAREISVSDLIEGMQECDYCNAMNTFAIDINDLINTNIEVEEYPNFPIGLFKDITDILDDDVTDNLSIEEYNKIQDIIQENNIKILNLNYIYTCRIQKCNMENSIMVFPISVISKLSISGLYQEIFQLSFYGNKSYSDIENLYPFERALYISMTKDKVEKNPIQGMQSMFG